MSPLAHVRLVASIAAPERETDFGPMPVAKWARYGWVSETHLWPGCAFFRIYSDTGRVALRQPDWSLN